MPEVENAGPPLLKAEPMGRTNFTSSLNFMEKPGAIYNKRNVIFGGKSQSTLRLTPLPPPPPPPSSCDSIPTILLEIY